MPRLTAWELSLNAKSKLTLPHLRGDPVNKYKLYEIKGYLLLRAVAKPDQVALISRRKCH